MTGKQTGLLICFHFLKKGFATGSHAKNTGFYGGFSSGPISIGAEIAEKYMEFSKEKLFWVFNEGNNRQALFRDDGDYFIFLQGLQKEVVPLCRVVAWCLVPQQFSILLKATDQSEEVVKQGSLELNSLADGFRRTTASYGRYFNRKYFRSGSVIRPGTKSIEIPMVLDWGEEGYYREVFSFIHHQPRLTGLVQDPLAWPHSSYAFYAGKRTDDFCDREAWLALLGNRAGLGEGDLDVQLRPEFMHFVERSNW